MTPKTRRAMGLAAAVVAAALVAYFFWSKKAGGPAQSTRTHEGPDPRDDAFMALYEAPPGATPCESSWNAMAAFQKRVEELRLPPPVEHFPDRETYLRLCNEIPPADQPCVIPKYESEHRAECQPALDRIWAPNTSGKPSFATLLPRRARRVADLPSATPSGSPSN